MASCRSVRRYSTYWRGQTSDKIACFCPSYLPAIPLGHQKRMGAGHSRIRRLMKPTRIPRSSSVPRRGAPRRVSRSPIHGDSGRRLLSGFDSAGCLAVAETPIDDLARLRRTCRGRLPSRLKDLTRRLPPHRLPAESESGEVLTQPVGVIGFGLGLARNGEELATSVR